ncbi:hypothetical protein O159_02990 [Leifsonia xyli subsp. cynodontis DSM 46306]|uniref:Secreted protein n=1 Tax=Leifsonia xyli subsp. cynodontis DSM 46306 TaxID=1389489 RepID=U3P6H9_LEIXC|nr:hypothetical protein [Leifsonia xyli]AGW40522.1 hypothetical protein O159_02990 [Leifsonia xyli subsp. cynodontis DSM 46306]
MRLRPVGVAAITLAAAITASLFAAAPANAESTTTTQTLVSSSCVAQLKDNLAADHQHPSLEQLKAACAGEVTSTVSQMHLVTGAGARALAKARHLSAAETANLVARAENGWVAYQDWREGYKSWLVKEFHEGRTYYDGSKAWVTSYEGYTGRHICHSGGSSDLFVNVVTRECTQPEPVSIADNSYQFEVSATILGVPVDYVVGLHAKVDGYGNIDYTTNS